MRIAQGALAPDEAWQRECQDEARVRILLVEDRPEYIALVEVALALASPALFDVVAARRLELAVTCLDQERYDAMLLDVRSCDRDGVQAIDAAGDLARRLPVIVLTGTQDRELARRAATSGARDRMIRERLDRAALPMTILRAVKRHRRWGGATGDPVICRIPESAA